ncbi:hypothetical protein E1180_12615 [Roseibium denhamense]|uniref:Uncharacterized protein n=1 Tax=Roseibium denhamense TaxID=76305 RepID=A0ABY1NFT5_9HYPH|nr:hypothetical protein [Roseibium denhamense]MTI06359.1 hypothetical protein [Roseibium denhamense]SMP08572.1 hypothetical protein SAMN06265374_0987 [Roseibium denhamense]
MAAIGSKSRFNAMKRIEAQRKNVWQRNAQAWKTKRANAIKKSQAIRNQLAYSIQATNIQSTQLQTLYLMRTRLQKPYGSFDTPAVIGNRINLQV